MPVKVPNTLPARGILQSENVFVMGEERASHQDIRALRAAILNLMPTKIATEAQLLRLLSNSDLQVEITLLHTASYESKSVDPNHLLNHYATFEDMYGEKFDGLMYDLPSKMFGVFEHRTPVSTERLLRGFDDIFLPHTRVTRRSAAQTSKK